MKIIILDRDGVINVDKEYIYRIEDFEFTEGIFDLLKYFQEHNYKLYVATSQSGIGRKFYREEDFLKVNNYMLNEFSKQGIHIEDVFYCPHHPDDNCDCRKPKIGMVDELFEENKDIDKKNSFVIGDKDSDIQLGHNLDLRTIRIVNNYPKTINADFEVFDLEEIKDIIPLEEVNENEEHNY